MEMALTVLVQTKVSIGAILSELVTTNHSTPYWWLAAPAHGYTTDFENAAQSVPLWQSCVAGLNPTLASSQLRLSVHRSPGGTANVLNWNTTTGRLIPFGGARMRPAASHPCRAHSNLMRSFLGAGSPNRLRLVSDTAALRCRTTGRVSARPLGLRQLPFCSRTACAP
jgi:hypothetical protein